MTFRQTPDTAHNSIEDVFEGVGLVAIIISAVNNLANKRNGNKTDTICNAGSRNYVSYIN